MKKAFVTGATGFIGSHLIEALLEDNWRVTCLVLPEENPFYMQKHGVKVIKGDILRIKEFCSKVPKECVVFHCAALTKDDNKSRKEYIKVNKDASIKLYQVLNCSKFIYISSNRADLKKYGHSYYGESKYLAEEALKKLSSNKKPVLIIRLSGVFGPRMKSSFRALFNLAQMPFVPVFNCKYQFTFVKNAIYSILFIQSKISEGSIAAGDPAKFTFKEIIIKIKNQYKSRGILVPLPNFVGKIMGIKMWEDDVSMAQRIGYIPRYNLNQGIAMTVNWLKHEKNHI